MHDWLGFGMLVLGVGLGIAAIFKRRSQNRTVLSAGAIRPEFATMGEIVRPITLFVVGFLAFMMSLFYFVFGGNSLLTSLDYAALMFVLLAYSGYLVVATANPSLVRAVEPARSNESGVARSAT